MARCVCKGSADIFLLVIARDECSRKNNYHIYMHAMLVVKFTSNYHPNFCWLFGRYLRHTMSSMAQYSHLVAVIVWHQGQVLESALRQKFSASSRLSSGKSATFTSCVWGCWASQRWQGLPVAVTLTRPRYFAPLMKYEKHHGPTENTDGTNCTLGDIAEKHAPKKLRVVTVWADKPWYMAELPAEKRMRHQCEKKYKTTRLESNKLLLKEQRI